MFDTHAHAPWGMAPYGAMHIAQLGGMICCKERVADQPDDASCAMTLPPCNQQEQIMPLRAKLGKMQLVNRSSHAPGSASSPRLNSQKLTSTQLGCKWLTRL